MRRSRMHRKTDRKVFSKTAHHVHPRNMVLSNRGGIRL